MIQIDARTWRRFHLLMMVVWALLLVPTLLWWHNSILWVAGMSHFSAWQAVRAEEGP